MIRRSLYALALLLAAATAEAATDITVAPRATTVAKGDSFQVRIEVQAGTTGVTVASGYVNFDVTKLQVTNVAAGTTLGNVLLNRYSNTAGTVDCSAGNSFGVTPPAGTFPLCTVTFGAAETASPTVLNFNSTSPRVTNAYGESGPDIGTVTDGSVRVTGPDPPRTATPTGADCCQCALPSCGPPVGGWCGVDCWPVFGRL